jgi:hypothetical protein
MIHVKHEPVRTNLTLLAGETEHDLARGSKEQGSQDLF